MNRDENQAKQLNKKIMLVHLLGAVGSILVGVSAFSIWGSPGDSFHSALDNPRVSYSMLALGAAILIWEMTTLLPLLKQRSQLANHTLDT